MGRWDSGHGNRLRPDESGGLGGPEIELDGGNSAAVGNDFVDVLGADSDADEWHGILVGIREIQIIRLHELVACASNTGDGNIKGTDGDEIMEPGGMPEAISE
jgi:hypothetical protein